MSFLSQCSSIITDRGISAPDHGKEVVDILNAVYKCYIYQLMYTVQLTGLKTFDSQIIMYYFTQKNDVNLEKQFQKHLSVHNRKHGVIDQVKDRKRASKIKCIDRFFWNCFSRLTSFFCVK